MYSCREISNRPVEVERRMGRLLMSCIGAEYEKGPIGRSVPLIFIYVSTLVAAAFFLSSFLLPENGSSRRVDRLKNGI